MPRRSAEELKPLIEELHDLEHGDTLADVSSRALLDRAARGSGRPDAEPGLGKKLGEEAALPEKSLETSVGNPFEILERGPTEAKEAALLGVLLAAGIARRLEEAEDEKARRGLVEKLLPRLDWLEATTGIAPYDALAATLTGPAADSFWTTAAESLAASARSEPLADPTEDARQRTRLLLRASALAKAPKPIRRHLAATLLPDLGSSELKRVALAALAGVDAPEAAATTDAKDSVTRRAASAARAPKVDGQLQGRPMGLVLRLLAAVTGLLLIAWLLRLAARYVLGYRRTGTASLTASTVAVEHELRLLGRVVRQGSTSYALRSLRSGGVEQRFRYLHLLVGALTLVVGVALGVNFLVEGACSGYAPLSLFGLAVIGGGILLDVLLEVLIPGRVGETSLALDFGRRKYVRLRGVKQDLATAFVKELEQLVPGPKTK